MQDRRKIWLAAAALAASASGVEPAFGRDAGGAPVVPATSRSAGSVVGTPAPASSSRPTPVPVGVMRPPFATWPASRALPTSPPFLEMLARPSMIAALAALLGTYLACHPILAFLRRGWGIKQADIFSSLTEQAKSLYLDTFGYSKSPNVNTAFRQMYVHRYGRYRLTAPLVLFVAVLLPLLFLACSTGVAGLRVEDGSGGLSFVTPSRSLLGLPQIALAAVAGAYAWVVASLIDGASRYNLPPQAVLNATLRLAVAVPLGYAVSAISEPGIAPFIAFAFGAFPLGEVQILLKRLSTNRLKIESAADPREDQVSRLDGIDQPTADRLESGDVMTIAQLAYCDPVQLSMRTNISFSAIIDAQSQALAWIYFADALPQMRGIGLRGAIEAASLVRLLDSTGKERADAIVQAASARSAIAPDGKSRTPIPPVGLVNALREIAGDPYTIFLVEVWRSVGKAPPATAHGPVEAAGRAGDGV